MTSVEQQFTEFATLASPRLRRTAFLLCGDWHTAEDLAQTALAKVFVSWRRISRQDAAQAYATRTLVNSYLAAPAPQARHARCCSARLPDRAVPAPAPELRLVVLDALAALPPKARAVVVLRYWEDLSVEQVADLLGCSTGNVKSQSARALDKLRALLADAAPTPSPACPPGARPHRGAARRHRHRHRHEEPHMDERSLRGLLSQAVNAEPPLGPVARNALRAGIRLRRRRRAQSATAGAAVIAAAVVAIPALTGAPHGRPRAGRATRPRRPGSSTSWTRTRASPVW